MRISIVFCFYKNAIAPILNRQVEAKYFSHTLLVNRIKAVTMQTLDLINQRISHTWQGFF